MTDHELMQQALAALCQSSQPAAGYRRNEFHLTPKPHVELYQEAVDALRARLAQPEPEPVAFIDKRFGELLTPSQDNAWVRWKMKDKLPSDDVPEPLYAASAQREWQGLTDEEIMAMRHIRDWTAGWTEIRYAREIEAKLREKNGMGAS